MPPLPVVNQVIKAEFEGTISGDKWANILHFHITGAPSDADCSALAHDFYTAFVANLGGGFWDPTTSLEACKVQDLTSLVSGSGAYLDHQTGTGPTGHHPSAQNCLLVNHTIARRYRGGHPRTYMAGVSASNLVSARLWDSGFIGSYSSAFAAFIAACLAATSGGVGLDGFVSVSYHSGGALRPVPVVDFILGSTAQTVVATQRRRVGR